MKNSWLNRVDVFGDFNLELSPDDWVLLLLIISILFFFIATIIFSLITIFLRFRNIKRARYWNHLEDKWNTKLLEVMAEDKPQSDLIASVRPHEELDFVKYLSRYARRIRGQEKTIIQELSRPFLHRVVQNAKSAEMEIRANAVNLLTTLGGDDAKPILLNALDDPSPLVAMIAARGLIAQKKPEHFTAVIQHIDRFEGWSITYLASMLVALGVEAVPALREAYASVASPPLVRIVAAETLYQLNDFEIVDDVVKTCRHSKNTELVSASLRLLTRIGTDQHLDVVRELAQHEDSIIRINAMHALSKLGNEQDIPLFEKGFNDANSWVAFQAASGMAELNQYEILERIAGSDHPRALIAHQYLNEYRKS